MKKILTKAKAVIRKIRSFIYRLAGVINYLIESEEKTAKTERFMSEIEAALAAGDHDKAKQLLDLYWEGKR